MENIGKKLKEKRLELGWSIEDISEKTRLTPKHIKALEEGDISFFHEDLSYLRFFVKSYCEAVGVDFEEVKDELRGSIDDYTTTFMTHAELEHQEIEKNVAKTEKLTRVKNASVKIKKRRGFRRPDVSLVSFVAIIGVVAILILFAFVMWIKSDPGKDAPLNEQPVAPAQTEGGKNEYPADIDKEKGEEEPTAEKELEIANGEDATHFILNNVAEGETLKLETAFKGSNSGYSVTIITDGKEEVKNNQVYNQGESASTEIEAKPGMKISVYIGCMYQAEIKINDKVVKLDDSVNPSAWPGSCVSYTFEFTVGEDDESSK